MKIRSDILRTYQSLHTWTGICAGLLLFIGFYAGSLTMFKQQLQQWVQPPTLSVAQASADLSANLPRWQQLLDATLAAQGEQMLAGFSLDLRDADPVIRWYSQGNARGLALDNRIVEARFDNDNQLRVTEHTENRFADLLDYLHRSAGIGGEIGHDQAGVYLLGVAAVLYFLALVSGVVILLPTLVKSFFALRTDKGASRLWLDSHNLVGIASLPFHFIIAWSVIVFAFHDLIYDGLAAFYGDTPMFAQNPQPRQSFDLNSLPPLAEHLAVAQAYSGDHQVVQLDFMRLNSPAPSVIVHMANPNGMMRTPTADYLYLQPFTLQVQPFSFSNQSGADYSNTVSGLFALHFGSYAGNWGRWGYFVMGLLGAYLFYSGNLLWLNKRSQKAGRAKSSRIMAALTIGVCLGSMLAVGITMLVGKLMGSVLPTLANSSLQNLNVIYLLSYYAVFAGFVAFALWRGAACAALFGLRALAVACALMPALSLLLVQFKPASTVLATTYGVDLAALVFAAAFILAANKTRSRLSQAPADSLWALPTKRTTTNNKADTHRSDPLGHQH